MVLVGYVIAGLAVGADVPASWTLIAELAPDGARGQAQRRRPGPVVLRPVVVLLLSLAMSPLGVLGIRIVFAHLFVLAICLWFARRSMKESEIWTAAERTVRERAARRRARPGVAGRRRHLVRARARAVQPPQRRRHALPHRHVRDLEPVGRDERLLPALHPAHGGLGEPGDERGHPVRELRRGHRLDLLHLHAPGGPGGPENAVRRRRAAPGRRHAAAFPVPA